jgi:hypothetical protein
MDTFKTRYRVRQKSPHSKFWIVEKCMVTPSDQEIGGHYMPVEIVSVPLERGAAYAFCDRLNAEETAKEAG